MVASIGSSVSNWSDSLFSKLDTKNKGYIDKDDMATALSAAGGASANGASSTVDDTFAQLDGDKDGKVTRSELSASIEKVGDELQAQADQARVARTGASAPQGAAPAGGPPAGGGGGSTDSSASYVAAADTNNDGTVSADEQAAYDKLMAQQQTAAAAGEDKDVDASADPDRELAKALNLLKAYADNGSASGAVSVSV
jgi:hypothetical protein